MFLCLTSAVVSSLSRLLLEILTWVVRILITTFWSTSRMSSRGSPSSISLTMPEHCDVSAARASVLSEPFLASPRRRLRLILFSRLVTLISNPFSNVNNSCRVLTFLPTSLVPVSKKSTPLSLSPLLILSRRS